MILAITGARDRIPTPSEMRAFWTLWHHLGADTLLHGAAPGTDSYVAEVVKGDGWTVLPFPVDHALDGPWPAAGPRRNRRMLRDGHANALAAFPGNRGTRDCTKAAQQGHLPVYPIRG